MRKYILIANKQSDIEFQYADFNVDSDKFLVSLKYSRSRVRLLNILRKLRLLNSNACYFLLFYNYYRKSIEQQVVFDDKNDYVFIIMGRVYEKYYQSIIRFLRMKYPSCKLVIYLADLVDNMRFTLEDAKRDFDIVCSFDMRDSQKYGLQFVLEPFSINNISKINRSKEIKYDVSFVGTARNRYDRIIWLYNELSKKGFKCDFYISGVDKNKQISKDGIHYMWLDFTQILEHISGSRCVVEIMQKDGYSATTRYAEAMLMKKNLLTDCPALEKNEDDNIIYFQYGSDFSTSDICRRNDIDVNKYIDMFSISAFVRKIDELLDYCSD